ncbi:transcriptional regulator [Mycobacterium dioxanotrophicus]|uniref:Transcriptional regulator n=1 Tax=Mycobacterium dioxanotrophicus TaxID=482462 RepID=A0A1Y0BWL9_9MYCO|nr:transcriptional regulator [Mycobacterium dioxanotrophicus]ART67301.1 transcriptional regulator [Mycobacterium dioxanotrophicus]
MEEGDTDDGIARAGAAAAARRRELGISQRELARQKVITAPALIHFEKGRSWPRERTRHTLEELLQWPAGTIARIRAGSTADEVAAPPPDGSESAVLVVDALKLALARFDTAIDDLPPASSPDFAKRASTILADLRKLEALAARAMRHSQGSPAEVVKSLGLIRRRYDELMLKAAAHPDASLGQRLYAARRRANLSAGEAAAVGGLSAELVESAETGKPMDPGSAARVEALIAELAEP